MQINIAGFHDGRKSFTSWRYLGAISIKFECDLAREWFGKFYGGGNAALLSLSLSSLCREKMVYIPAWRTMIYRCTRRTARKNSFGMRTLNMHIIPSNVRCTVANHTSAIRKKTGLMRMPEHDDSQPRWREFHYIHTYVETEETIISLPFIIRLPEATPEVTWKLYFSSDLMLTLCEEQFYY